MTQPLEASEVSVMPNSNMSSNKYASYLWLGHCIHQPENYKETLIDFHQDDLIAHREFSRFQEKIEVSPSMILLPLMGRIINSARIELGEGLPRTGAERRRLQVYLVGEVSTRGKEIAQQQGLFEDDPAMALVKSPFRDSMLVENVIRYRRCSRASRALINYATIDRLLPGYVPAVTSEE